MVEAAAGAWVAVRLADCSCWEAGACVGAVVVLVDAGAAVGLDGFGWFVEFGVAVLAAVAGTPVALGLAGVAESLAVLELSEPQAAPIKAIINAQANSEVMVRCFMGDNLIVSSLSQKSMPRTLGVAELDYRQLPEPRRSTRHRIQLGEPRLW